MTLWFWSFGNRLEYELFVGANFAMILIAHLQDYSHKNELSDDIIWRCLKILHKHRLEVLVKNMLQQPVWISVVQTDNVIEILIWNQEN